MSSISSSRTLFEFEVSELGAEIQTLTFKPEVKIHGSFDSPAREALIKTLHDIRRHPQCESIFWMRKRETSNQILIISNWTNPVDDAISKAYIPAMKQFLLETPEPSIHTAHEFHHISSYTVSNLISLYFPIDKCTEGYQELVERRIKHFYDTTNPNCPVYDLPDEMFYRALGWVSEPQAFESQDTKRFIIYFIFTSKEDEAKTKRNNPNWRSLMTDLNNMGLLGKEESLGRVLEVAGGQPGVEAEEGDEETEEQMYTLVAKGLKRLRLLAFARSSAVDSVITCQGYGGPLYEWTDAERDIMRKRLDRIR